METLVPFQNRPPLTQNRHCFALENKFALKMEKNHLKKGFLFHRQITEIQGKFPSLPLKKHFPYF